MKQLQLREEMIMLVNDLVGEWSNQETMELLSKLDQIGHKELALDLESAVNKFVSDMIDRAFITGYQVGQNPELMIFRPQRPC